MEPDFNSSNNNNNNSQLAGSTTVNMAISAESSNNKNGASAIAIGQAAAQQFQQIVNNSAKPKKPVLAGVDKLNTAEELKMREKRANRFQSEETSAPIVPLIVPSATTFPQQFIHSGNKNSISSSSYYQDNSHLQLKCQRGSSSIAFDSGTGEFDMESLKIVGTNQKLEKDYLRLTSAPHPSAVRPESVLRKSIQLLKKKWADQEVEYVYMCSQLKSIRQDLTVQHIQNGIFIVSIFKF
jgi:hypothetical protein